jgi:hypothetical protein
MPFEYDSLVGHLNIVNRRALSIPPPGALVEVAPQKAARGREADTFFALVLPSGETLGPAQFYEQMAQLAAEHYFASSGSVTSGVRGVLDHLNQNLLDHNLTSGKKRYEATILVAVLRGTDLYVGKVGSAILLLWHGRALVSFPESLTDDDAVFRPPLGVHAIPDARLTRYSVGVGARLILADASLADIDSESLVTALGVGVAADTAAVPDLGTAAAADLSAVPDLGAALLRLKEAAQHKNLTNAQVLAVELVSPDGALSVPAATVTEGQSTAQIAARPPAPPPDPTPAPDPALPRKTRIELERETAAAAAQEQRDQRLVDGATQAATTIDQGKRVFDHYFQTPKEGQTSWFASPQARITALLIPLVAAGLAVALWLSGTGSSEFELCVRDAQRAAETARSIASSDVFGTRAAWRGVQTLTERCQRLRADDATITAITREAQQIIDILDRVDRRTPNVIAAWSGAVLSSIVLQGLEVYALDDANNLVYRVTLDENGANAVANTAQPIANMRNGTTVNGIPVGDIFDIDWAEEGGGNAQGRVITALDTGGVLVSCSPRFISDCSAQRLLAVENWGIPTAMRIWQGRLYVLDTGRSQLWRYDPTSGTYATIPSEYFSGQNRPTLSNAIDFAIDENGAVYILLSDGTMLKFIRGQQVDFGFASFPETQPLTAVNGMYLNTDPLFPSLFLLDRANRTVFETSQAGSFFSSFRAFDETQFGALSGVVADIKLDRVFVTSGNAIFSLPRGG